MTRPQVIEALVEIISAIQLDHPLRIGIDGVDCSGKTMLADELVQPLKDEGKEVIRSSIDGFHNPREVRYRQGKGSPIGYFEDSFDLESVVEHVLRPLGLEGSRKYKTKVFDYRTDSIVDQGFLIASNSSTLLFEGVFLHRPELLNYWDFTIFVDTDFDVTIQRAFLRDREYFGDLINTETKYR